MLEILNSISNDIMLVGVLAMISISVNLIAITIIMTSKKEIRELNKKIDELSKDRR